MWKTYGERTQAVLYVTAIAKLSTDRPRGARRSRKISAICQHRYVTNKTELIERELDGPLSVKNLALPSLPET